MTHASGEIYDLEDIEKTNSESFLEIKLLAENSRWGKGGKKISTYLVQKNLVKNLLYSQRLYCWLIVEGFLFC